MKRSNLILRISLALTLLSVSLMLTSYFLGLIPDARHAELDARASIAESLATHIVSKVETEPKSHLEKVLDTIAQNNDSVLSLGLRKADGEILVSAGSHPEIWPVKEGENSTSTHVSVPVYNGRASWGYVEIVFTELPSNSNILGLPKQLLAFFAFLVVFGFICSFVILRRSLKVLDPSEVVPERVQKAFDTLAEGVIIIDRAGSILLTNQAFNKLLNYDAETLTGKQVERLPWVSEEGEGFAQPWSIAVNSNNPVMGHPMVLQLNGQKHVQFLVNATPIASEKGQVQGAIVTFDDVTEIQNKNEQLSSMVSQLRDQEVALTDKNEQLYRLATRDPMTNCLNRRAFSEAFDRGIRNAREKGHNIFCMMIDLDHFKNVNDTYGHAVGDDVIVMIGQILTRCSQNVGIVSRYGGEEFCTAFFNISMEQCLQIAEHVRLETIEQSKTIGVLAEPITSSIGIVQITDENLTPEAWVSRADEALYAAKTTGRNRAIEWSNMPEQEESVDPEFNADRAVQQGGFDSEIVRELQQAMMGGQLYLKFKPVMDLQSREITAVDTVLSSTRRCFEEIGLSELIFNAEQSGVIIPIGHWVLENAIQVNRGWREAGIAAPVMSVKLSPVQLCDLNAVSNLAELVQSATAEGIGLQFNITDTLAIADMESAITAVDTLRQAGAIIGLDNFGVGRSSFLYLQNFKPDIIKIGSQLTDNIEESSDNTALVTSMVQTANSFHSRILAKGISSDQQMEQMATIGFQMAQGDLISRPLREGEAKSWLQLFAHNGGKHEQANTALSA